MEFKVITTTEEIAVLGFKTAKENCELATNISAEKAERKKLKKRSVLPKNKKH